MDDTPGNPSAQAKPRATATLPHFLFNPFQRYKRDTDRLASWLGATANSLGYYAQKPGKSPGNNSKPAAVAAPSSSRLKGKARKEARAAQAFQSAATGSHSTRPTPPADHDRAADSTEVTYFSTSEFIALAEFIANFSDPPVTISPRIMDWARRAIRERRHCAAWFTAAAAAGRGCAVTEESNQSHEYFIETLELVVSILEPLVGKPAGPGEASKGVIKVDPATVELAEGRYSVLSSADGGKQEDSNAEDDGDDQNDWDVVEKLVQETVGDRTSLPKIKKKNSSTTMRVGTNPFTATRRVYRVKDDDEIDFIIAQTTHVMDVADAHRAMKDMWFEYVTTRSPSQQIVGLVTTAAADAIQADHDSLCAAYPAFMANEQQTLDSLFSLIMIKSDQDDVFQPGTNIVVMGERITIPPRSAEQEDQPFEFILESVVEGTCLGERLVLESLRQVFREADWKERVLRSEDVLDSILSPDLPSELFEWKKKNVEALVRDMEELRKLYATWEQVKGTFAHLSSILAVIDTLDSIFQTDDPIPLPKLFAAKLYLIFHRLVNTAPNPDLYYSRVYIDFLDPAAFRMSHSLRQCLTHVPETTQANMEPQKWDAFLRFHIDMMPWLHAKALEHCEIFFPVHPWFAGAVGGRGLAMTHGIACQIERRKPYIYAGAYLYAAVVLGMRDLGLAPRDKDVLGGWPRMDAFFEHVGGQERVFAGREPDCMADLFKSLMIHLDMSPVDWALRFSPPAGRASAVKNMRLRRDIPSASHFKLKPLVYDAMPPVVKALFGRYDRFGQTPVERINEVHRSVGECLVDVVPYGDMPEDCGDAKSESRSTADDKRATDKKTKKLPLKLLPLSEYLAYLKSELVAYEPALSPPLLLLRAQACRALAHLKSVLQPHIPFLAPRHRDFGNSNDVILQVSIFISSFLSAEGQSASENRRKILCEILPKMNAFLVEMAATELKMDLGNVSELGENAPEVHDYSGEQVAPAAEGE